MQLAWLRKARIESQKQILRREEAEIAANLPYFNLREEEGVETSKAAQSRLQLHAPAARNQSGTLDRRFASLRLVAQFQVRNSGGVNHELAPVKESLMSSKI